MGGKWIFCHRSYDLVQMRIGDGEDDSEDGFRFVKTLFGRTEISALIEEISKCAHDDR
jgi:hypothetical protein